MSAQLTLTCSYMSLERERIKSAQKSSLKHIKYKIMVPVKSFSDQQVNPIAAAHFLAAQQQVHMLRNSNSIVGRYSWIDYDVIMTSQLFIYAF